MENKKQKFVVGQIVFIYDRDKEGQLIEDIVSAVGKKYITVGNSESKWANHQFEIETLEQKDEKYFYRRTKRIFLSKEHYDDYLLNKKQSKEFLHSKDKFYQLSTEKQRTILDIFSSLDIKQI